ncbi:hypothetical protein ACR4U3_000003 [Salmonella enterica]
MTTISNNKLPEWRKTLNKSVENYQSMRAWYEENPDNPSAEQDMDAAEGDIEKLLKQYGVLIVLSLMDEIDELQELRKADSAPPAQIVSIPDDWQTCEKLSDDSYVDNALRELVEDTTGDNGVRVVQAVIRALRDSGLIRTYPDLSQPVDPQISEYEKTMLQAGNSPVIPDGYALVPVNPTDEMIEAAMNCEDVLFNSDESFCVQFGNIYEAMLAAAPQPEANNE